MTRSHELGVAGERMAEEHLRRRGLAIVDRRYRCRRGEVDIVARDGKTWVFIEVKTRRGTRMGKAAEAVTSQKLARLRHAVDDYVFRHGLQGKPVRCDLVTVDIDEAGVAQLAHFPGAMLF